ncbi:MAG: MFS transporter [Gammaproteobacteria bacterium]
MREYFAWYLSARMPFVARALYGRELRAWTLFSFGLGAVEGGVVGVIAKNAFEGAVGDLVLNQSVAIVAGAPAFANILSFMWAGIASGRDKVRVLTGLKLAAGVSLAAIAIAPINGWGLLVFVAGVIGARLFWSGIVTVRSAIWRANYPRHVRGNFTARVTVLAALGMACTGIVTGLLLDRDPLAFRYVYPVAALAMFSGMAMYARVRVRGHRRLLAAERAEQAGPGRRRPTDLFGILRTDHDYRRYLTWMFVFGSGNLMIVAQLVVILNEQLGLSRLQQMLITSSIPFAVIPLSIPLWARYFDRVHIVRYRAVQSWSFVAAMTAFLVGVFTREPAVLWLGAALLGTGYAGGRLGWNLGHNDFASDARATEYMGLHVTLTGVRGMVAPLVGVGAYQVLQGIEEGLGVYALFLPLALTTIGALGFVRLRYQLTGA